MKQEKSIGERGALMPPPSKYTPGPKKQPKAKTVILTREDFSEYGLSLGLWETFVDDMGLPLATREVEITITKARRVS